MKKTLALLLCAASMLALLAGCGSKSTDDKAPLPTAARPLPPRRLIIPPAPSPSSSPILPAAALIS